MDSRASLPGRIRNGQPSVVSARNGQPSARYRLWLCFGYVLPFSFFLSSSVRGRFRRLPLLPYVRASLIVLLDFRVFLIFGIADVARGGGRVLGGASRHHSDGCYLALCRGPVSEWRLSGIQIGTGKIRARAMPRRLSPIGLANSYQWHPHCGQHLANTDRDQICMSMRTNHCMHPWHQHRLFSPSGMACTEHDHKQYGAAPKGCTAAALSGFWSVVCSPRFRVYVSGAVQSRRRCSVATSDLLLRVA